MTNIYIKQDGRKVEVEVNEQVADVMCECRRGEWRSDSKENYHCTSLDTIESEGSVFADPSLSAEDEMIEKETKAEQMQQLIKGMSQLLPEQIKLVYWVYIKNIPQDKIAKHLGITKQAVFNRLQKILKKMKKVSEKGVD